MEHDVDDYIPNLLTVYCNSTPKKKKKNVPIIYVMNTQMTDALLRR